MTDMTHLAPHLTPDNTQTNGANTSQPVREIPVWDTLLRDQKAFIIQYSYYDNEPAGDQFITFMISESSPVIALSVT